MGNKISIVFYLLLLLGCNDHPKKIDCEAVGALTGIITLKGFEKLKIDQIYFQNGVDTIKYHYDITKIDSIKPDEIMIKANDEILFGIANNDFKIIINNRLEFLVSDVNIKSIERFGNFGSVGYECSLIDYKVNDSLMKENEIIIKYSLLNESKITK